MKASCETQAEMRCPAPSLERRRVRNERKLAVSSGLWAFPAAPEVPGYSLIKKSVSPGELRAGKKIYSPININSINVVRLCEGNNVANELLSVCRGRYSGTEKVGSGPSSNRNQNLGVVAVSVGNKLFE